MYKQTALSNVDSYKLGHPDMLPEGFTKANSNFTPRSLRYVNINVPKEFQTDVIAWVGFYQFSTT